MKWDFKKEHHKQVLKVMKKILENETFEKPMSDAKLAEAIKAEGVYCTPTIVFNVRTANSIGNGEQRRIEIFARNHEKRKRK